VWDHESGEYIRTLKGHTNPVNGVSFAPTGSFLASCSTDLSIKLWEFSQTYTCLRTLRGHDHTISSVRFVPQPNLLLQQQQQPSVKNGTNPAETSSTGLEAARAGAAHILTASRDCTVKLWDVETGYCEHTFTDHNDWVRCLAVRASDGAVWASAGNDQVIYVYDTATRSTITELRGHEHVVESLAFVTEEAGKKGGAAGVSSRETKHVDEVRDYLVSGSRDRSVRLWKVSDGSCVTVFTAHENWVRSVLLHPSGRYVISCSDDKSIRIFDIQANRCLRSMDKAHDHFITAIEMHHTLPILMSASVDRTLRCWALD
jgi:platelet-activating factor acetylhydrolase IB subunit alpha